MIARIAFLALAAVATTSCQDITAARRAGVWVTLTPKAGSAACVYADPEPAAVRVKEGISFVNKSSVQITLVLRQDNVPLVAVAPGDTSRAVKFSDAGVYYYYNQGCGSTTTETHTLSVTIN
jgi:plastocyanin